MLGSAFGWRYRASLSGSAASEAPTEALLNNPVCKKCLRAGQLTSIMKTLRSFETSRTARLTTQRHVSHVPRLECSAEVLLEAE
jgi:hypothetical protein